MKKLLFLLLLSVLYSCSNYKTTLGEIDIEYNKKNDSYKITYPEYNKVYPKPVKIDFKKPKSIKDGIVISYNIKTDNVPLLLDIKLTENNIQKKYTIEYPPVNRDINLTLYPTNFTPQLEENKKIQEIEISLESIGDVDTKDYLAISFKEMKTFLKEEAKAKKNTRVYPNLVIPESGHFAKSNPPFIIFSKTSPLTRVYVSQDPSFENSYIYNIREYNFFSMTNVLSNGKWYIAFDENADTNLRSTFHFFINDLSEQIEPITNRTFTNSRPFIFTDKASLDVIDYFYNARRYENTIFTRNLSAFKVYTSERMGKWSKDKIIYQGEVRNSENVSFDTLDSHIMAMSLYAYFETNNIEARNDIKTAIKDIASIDETKIENFNTLDATVILANSLMMPFDLLYNIFSAEELILMKQAFIKYGNTLYKYITNNPEIYRKKESIKYITTLGLISLNMLNENLQEEAVRKWYYFSMNYINSLIVSMFAKDGSFKIAISDAFDMLMPIMTYAVSLKNTQVFDLFSLESFKNIGNYLSTVGYPSGYTLPVGYSFIDYRTKMRFDNGERSAVMELLSKIYRNALYKNYANYALSEALNIKYLPFMIIWNNYYLNDNNVIRNIYDYESSYFKNMETSIYNANILNRSNAYLAIYAKGYNADSSFKLNHNDRMSFLYYNYGDSIINEAGYNGTTNKLVYKDVAKAVYHNTINIDYSEMLENIGSFSYIKSMTNNDRFFYSHAVAQKKYIYNQMLKRFERRFYYLKPNILIVKEDIEAIPDIINNFQGYGNEYSWRITTKLSLSLDTLENKFIIEGEYSTTYISFVTDIKLKYSVSSTNLENTIYTAEVQTLEKVKSFNPWIIITTIPKNNVRVNIRNYALDTNIEINSFSDTNLSFNILNRNYNITSHIENTNSAVYTQTKGNVIITSD